MIARAVVARLAGDRRGAVTMMVAGGAAMLLGMLAISIDLGSAYLESRRLQGIADAAALAAVAAPDDPAGAARRAIAANGWTRDYDMALVPGGYTPDRATAPAARFVSGGGTAVRITLTSSAPTFFAGAIGAARAIAIRRVATAARSDMAAFSIGSRLAAMNGGIANALLSALLGADVNLSVMDYESLAAADIDVLAFADALRSGLHLRAASFSDALGATVTLPQALSAMADALADAGNAAAAAPLRTLAAQAGLAAGIRPAELVDLGPLGAQDHVATGTHVAVDAYAMLTAALTLSNGARQVRLDLGAQVPGVAATRVGLAIGERAAHSPWLAVSDRGEPVVRTAQTRLTVEARLAAPAALAALGATTLSLPLYLELAEAQAKLSAISCPGGVANAAVTLSVLPGVGHASLAAIDAASMTRFDAAPAESAALVATAPLIRVTGQSRVDLSSSDWQDARFDAPDIAAGRVRTVSSSGVASAIAASLVQRANLQASAGGIGINASAATALVGGALTSAAPALDTLIDQLTLLLGLRYGQADARVDGVRCGQPVLVM